MQGSSAVGKGDQKMYSKPDLVSAEYMQICKMLSFVCQRLTTVPDGSKTKDRLGRGIACLIRLVEQTSRTFAALLRSFGAVALYSPSYFVSERAAVEETNSLPW